MATTLDCLGRSLFDGLRLVVGLRVCVVKYISPKENRPNYSSDSAAYALIAEKLQCSGFALREWRIQAGHDAGELPGRSGADKDRTKELKREKRGKLLGTIVEQE